MNIKVWWIRHKHQILLFLVVIAVIALVGCTTGQGSAPPPPSGPIGGGCG